MTAIELTKRSERANDLKVFKVGDGQYYVESSKGKICYRVMINDQGKNCACGDFAGNSNDPQFTCKHILAVINANGNLRTFKDDKDHNHKPKLDGRFLTTIKGKEFVVYAGLLDMAHQIGIKSITVEAEQYPDKDNGMEAICRAIVYAKNGEQYIEWGDANPKNVVPLVKEHILRIACTRAKARALRDMTNIGITCLEELGELTDENSDEADKVKNRTRKKSEGIKPDEYVKTEAVKNQPTAKNQTPLQGIKPDEYIKSEAENNRKQPTTAPAKDQTPPHQAQQQPTAKPVQATAGKPKMSVSQKNAIINLGKRRGLKMEELEKMSQEHFNLTLDYLSSQDASSLIRTLQQAA